MAFTGYCQARRPQPERLAFQCQQIDAPDHKVAAQQFRVEIRTSEEARDGA